MIAPGRPKWQSNPIFKFFAGLKLAMILLAVLTGACIFGTIYESGFDAKVARYYVYQAQWFNIWLLLLAVNLICAAFSRWPWKQHHVAFLTAHLGIITLMAGALIGQMGGIEGTMTLQEGDQPHSILSIDERILEIAEPDGRMQAVNAEVFNRVPSPEHPRYLTRTAEGWKIDLTGYAKVLEVALSPKKTEPGKGMPAVRVSMATGMMAQKIENWLMLGHPRESTLNLGLATITLTSGTAEMKPQTATESAAPESPGMVDVEEMIFAFQNVASQVAHVQKGVSTGAKVHLDNVTGTSKGKLTVELSGTTHSFSVDQCLGQSLNIPGTDLTLAVREYWPDFQVKDGEPGTASQNPNNPATLLVLSGKTPPSPTAPAPPDHTAMGMDNASPANSLTIYVAEDGSLSYELVSRKLGRSSGPLKLNEPLITGWADWKFTVTDLSPSATPNFTAQPVPKPGIGNSRYTEGIQVRATRNAESRTEWVPLGWQIGMDVPPGPLRFIYGFRQASLPIAVTVNKFEVKRYPGTERPSSFKSDITVSSETGESASGSCWMNNPMSFPANWMNTWSGLTYKISQASWNPQNPRESTLQILRDPGWGLKWIGSLLITAGIFFLFYVPRFRRKFGQKKNVPSPAPQESPVAV